MKLVCESGVIVDEFHRLGEEFFAFLRSGECLDEELVLLTSTLHYFKRLAHGPDAPLAGLFQEMRVSLLSPVELLPHKWGVGPRSFGDACLLPGAEFDRP